MRITKFVHACLLVETPNSTAVIDPGVFSWESGLFDVASLTKLDHIIITHEHEDHFSIDFVEALIKKFPKVCVVSTTSVLDQLSQKGVGDFSGCKSDDVVKALDWGHESMDPLSPGPTPCQNIGIHYANMLTHPGDSYQVTESKSVFAMPLAGPWGTAIDGVRLAVKLKPKFVIPIHDWMWNEKWRGSMYDRMEVFFKTQNITFLKPLDGQPIEIPAGD